MARRVMGGINKPSNIYADLALLGKLTNEEEAEIAPEDLIGTSQEPADYSEIVGTPQFGDVRQNQVIDPNQEYVNSLRAISQLPLAMSDDDNIRKDALENLDGYQRSPSDAIQEEQMQGLSGEQGAMQSKALVRADLNKKFPDPLDLILQRVQENPELLNQLPEETRQKVFERQWLKESEDFAEPSSLTPKALPDLSALPEEERQDMFQKQWRNEMQPFAEPPSNTPKALPDLSALPEEERQDVFQKQWRNEMQPFAQKVDQENTEISAPSPPSAPAQNSENQQKNQPIVPSDQPITQDMVADYPEQKPQMGSIEKVEEDPVLQKDLMELAGKPIDEEQMDRSRVWQDIYSKRKEELNAEEKTLMQQAESGTLSTFDKVALGIAIAVPILIALRYGATPGLLSAGEGLKAFSTSLQQQQKDKTAQNIKNKERLGEISKEKLQLEEKNIDIDKKIIDSIPDKAARKFLGNKKFRKFGEKIGISTGDPDNVLWLLADKFDTSDKGVEHANKVIHEGDETVGIMRDSNKVLNDVLEILDQLPQDTGVWDSVKKNAQWFTSAGGKNPFGGAAPKIKVVDSNGNIREVDAFAQLKQKINLLQDVYNKQILGGTRLTGNVTTHWGGILADPSDVMDWLSQDLNAFKDTTMSLKDIMNSREVENLVGKGFVREPLEQSFPSYKDKIIESDENVINQIRANPAAYKGKVK